VLKDLPPKSWSICSLPTDGVPTHLLSDDTCEAAEMAEAARMIAEALGDMEGVRAAIEAQIAAMTPSFDRSAATRAELGAHKVAPTLEYLRALPADECVLVFCHHKQVARAIYGELRRAGEGGILMDGDVDAAVRVDLVDQFQGSTDPRFRFVVATIESAKEGLTITRCSRVVFAEQAWTPGTMSQAEDRAHRIGQTRNVQVDYLVFNGTMDGRLCELLARKGRIAQAILDDVVEHADEQAEVVIPERVERTAAFTAHEVGALLRERAAERGARSIARSIANRGHGGAEYVPTRGQVEAMLACMATLASMDADRAREDNGIGFAKSDSYAGHAIAGLSPDEVTPQIFALGASLARKYRGQLGDAAVEAVLKP